MKIRTAAFLTAVVAVTLAAGATAAVSAVPDAESGASDYSEQQAQDATRAALDATGGGTVNSVERDSENGATWEVEVTRPGGGTVDVRLDEQYALVVIEGDSDSANDR